jgi:hypothetical protein
MSERSPAELILAHQKRIDEYNGEEPDGATALGCCNQSIATSWIADANARSGRGPSVREPKALRSCGCLDGRE